MPNVIFFQIVFKDKMSSRCMSEENNNKESFENNVESLLETVSDAEVKSRISFEEFTNERELISHNAFGKKQMKIKVLEVSDENPLLKWKFGDRVKITKIMITVKHLTTQQVEEAEFDIEDITLLQIELEKDQCTLEISEKRSLSLLLILIVISQIIQMGSTSVSHCNMKNIKIPRYQSFLNGIMSV